MITQERVSPDMLGRDRGGTTKGKLAVSHGFGCLPRWAYSLEGGSGRHLLLRAVIVGGGSFCCLPYHGLKCFYLSVRVRKGLVFLEQVHFFIHFFMHFVVHFPFRFHPVFMHSFPRLPVCSPCSRLILYFYSV